MLTRDRFAVANLLVTYLSHVNFCWYLMALFMLPCCWETIHSITSQRILRLVIDGVGQSTPYRLATSLGGGYNYDSTAIRLFYNHSTTVRRP